MGSLIIGGSIISGSIIGGGGGRFKGTNLIGLGLYSNYFVGKIY